ncbi:hypothetical protein IJ843_08550 [bacterium]|nr:hypothetical protein [bacterium]
MIIFLRLISVIFLIVVGYFCYELKSYGMAAFACSGFVIGILFTMSFALDIARKLKAYKRELEKSSINTDESDSKVRVLESKIEVLEKALKEALNK